MSSIYYNIFKKPFGRQAGRPAFGGDTAGYPQPANLLAFYAAAGFDTPAWPAFRPVITSATPEVKGSAFTAAVPEDVPVTGLLTTDTITAGGGTVPTCTTNGVLTISADCWDIYVHRAGEVWAYWPGINIGGAFEIDASGNGHTLYLTTTTITERLDGSGTDYRNEHGLDISPTITGFFDGFTLPASGTVTNDGDGQYNSIMSQTNSLISGGVESIIPIQPEELGEELATPATVVPGAWTDLGGMAYQIAGDGTYQMLSMPATIGKKCLVDITWEGTGLCKSAFTTYPTGAISLVDIVTSGRYVFFYIPSGTTWQFGRAAAGNIINGTLTINSIKEIIKPWRDYGPSTTVNFWGDSHTLNIAPRMDERIHNATVYNGAVGGIGADEILTLFMSHPEKWNQPTYICAGSNGVATNPALVIASVDAMVAELTTDNYIILSPIGNNTATTGSAYRDNINTVKAHLLATYGAKYFDVEQFIIDSYDPEIPQDVTDYNNGITPTSLRSDAAHLNYLGYSMVADKILELFPSFCTYEGVDILPAETVITASGDASKYTESDPTVFKRCLVEPYSIQRFYNSSAPVTQTSQSLVAGTYTLWCEGTGSITATSGTAVGTFGVATAGSPATIVITTAGTVVLTCAGTLTWGQLETLPFKTNKIYSPGNAVARDARVVNIPNTLPVSSGSAQNVGISGRIIPQATPLTGRYVWGNYTDASNYTAVLFSATQMIARKRIGGTNYDVAVDISYTADQAIDFIVGFTDQGSFLAVRVLTGAIWGDWIYGNNSNATAAKIATTHQVGSDGNGGNQVFAHFQFFSQFSLHSEASLDLYKAEAISGISYPGPLNRSAEVTEGTTLLDAKLKFPLGPGFQGIAELGGEAVVDLATFTSTEQVRVASRGILVYDQPLTYAESVRADRYLGYSIPAEVVSLWNASEPTTAGIGPQPVYASSSQQPDANGNLQDFPVNIPGRGVEVHPAYQSLTPPPTTVIVIEGDSRSAEESPAETFWVDYITRWPVAYGQTINNYAWGGKALSDALAGYAAGAHTKAPSDPTLGFYVAMIGFNDLGTGLNRTGAAVYEDIKTLWALAKADGFKVVACTETGGNGWPAANTEQQLIYNALVRSDPTLYDYLLEPDIHVPVTTGAYYIDGIHPTDDGAQALADMVAAALPQSVPHINEAKTITLTAQDYCLQVLGTGGVVVKSGMVGSNLAPSGGTFDTGIAGYNNGGGYWTWADGAAIFDNALQQSALQGLNATVGVQHIVIVDILAITGGYYKIRNGGVDSPAFTTTGTKAFIATAVNAGYGVAAFNATGLVMDNLRCFVYTDTNVETGTPLQFAAVEGDSVFTPNESCTGWMLTADGGYAFPFVHPGTSLASTAATTEVGLSVPFDTRMTAALGGVFTAAALVQIQASSAEITADTNILAVNNNVTGGIYAASGGVLKAFDGTNTATVTVTGGWARGETPLIAWKTNTAGTKQYIGYKKAADADITWGTEANYDGSANPGTHFRFGYNVTDPRGYKQSQLWNRPATNAEIIALTRYAL